MDIMMNQKETKRAQVMALLTAGKIDQKEAGKRLAVSVRQIRRIVRRFAAYGLPGLVSKKRGQPSNRRLPEETKRLSIELISTHYRDFGPTLAQEKLHERHGITLSVERTRQLMIAEGLWKPRKGAGVCVHPQRCRRARLGELIQIDGSPHDWFEGRSAFCTLLVFIDDASGRLMQLRFAPAETTLSYMRVLHDYITTYGIPVALYSDKHSVFRVNAREAAATAETQFSRAARELGIECIHAHSPQAKGRVERANQTLQDRLIKEMRLAGISDIEAANAWLPGFMADFNRRFAVQPAAAQDAHLRYAGTAEALVKTLSVQISRTLSKNLSCQHEGRLMQVKINGTGLGMRGAKVMLHQHFDGTETLSWRGRRLVYTVMTKAQKQALDADGKTVNARVDQALIKRDMTHKRAHKPAANHPWARYPIGKPATEGRYVTP